MDLLALLQSIQSGRVRTELLSLKIATPSGDQFSGEGFLSWSRRNGVQIAAITDGAEKLTEQFWNQLNRGRLGQLAGPSDYATLDAVTRDGHRVRIERLFLDCFDVHQPSPRVIWRIREGSIHSAVTCLREEPGFVRNYTDILMTGGHSFVWPRRTTMNQGCLEFDCCLGHVKAFKAGHGLAKVAITHDQRLDVANVIKSVILAFSFWASRVVDVIAYHSQGEANVEKRIMLRPPLRSNHTIAPPLGHTINLELEAAHEAVIAKAVNFFFCNDCEELASALHAFYTSDGTSFSTHSLVASAVLEALAKRTMTKPVEVISDNQIATVRDFLASNGFGNELVNRFNGFMAKLNETGGSNAINHWAKIGFLGFAAEDALAWRRLRHSTAHGTFSIYGDTLEERQKSVRERSRVYNMINKLMLYTIGYRGKYFDYGSWDISELNSGQA